MSIPRKIKKSSHFGIFHKHNTVWDGAALVMCGTIGAGVLSLPYAISQVGVVAGLGLMMFIGILMTALNIFIGEIVYKTKKQFQLVGLARRYFGRAGEFIMATIMYTVLFGVLLVYMIGVGDLLSGFFGGEKQLWSLGFFVIAMSITYIGMRTVKIIEMFLLFFIFCVVIFLSFVAMPSFEIPNIQYFDLGKFFVPYGILIFAFHGTTAVPEVYSILSHKKHAFKQALFLGGLGNILLYFIFTLVVVGVTGLNTTEIATVGLGAKLGPSINIMGNFFALFAMSTAFLMSAVVLKDSFMWDFKLRPFTATGLVAFVPLLIFLLGMQSFIGAIDVIGGVFMSLEIVFLLLIFWKAKRVGDIEGKNFLSHTWLIFAGIVFMVSVGMIYKFIGILL